MVGVLVQTECLKFEINECIGLLTLNRPKALNALNNQLLDELNEMLNHIEREQDLRCLILTGEGDKAFVAGADIKEMSSLDPSAAKSFSEKGQKVFRRLETLPMVVIAAVNGFALGGGCELALACDFIIASKNAKFGLPEVSLGIIPAFGGTQRAPRKLGAARASEMIFTGKHYDADRALQYGLVNDVVEPSELIGTCMELAKMISSRGPKAIAAAKESIRIGLDLPIDEGFILERTAFGDLFRTQDSKEGTAAFMEKRPAHFVGK